MPCPVAVTSTKRGGSRPTVTLTSFPSGRTALSIRAVSARRGEKGERRGVTRCSASCLYFF